MSEHIWRQNFKFKACEIKDDFETPYPRACGLDFGKMMIIMDDPKDKDPL